MSTPTPAPGAPLRVMTWNLWWRFGDWRARREAILAVLAQERPDVVGLQEVWADEGENLAQWLGERLGMHVAWSPSPAPQRWRRRLAWNGEDPAVVDGLQFGNAVLSRHPLLDQEVRELPGGGDEDEGRTALKVLVDAPRRPLPFTTTHLNSSPAESAVRVEQVRALVPFVVGGHRRGEHYPPVLTGDFNAVAESDELRLAGGYLTPGPVPGVVLVDSWRFAAPDDPGFTWDRRNPFVARVHQPSARIDHVLVGLPPFTGEGSVRDVRLVATEPVGGVWASDHAAVVVDLEP
ncbi:endonuclease/exonuclease/phosphatase family protein [Kineococcus radiotolerans]|uniref:Endonuclease/exonuclease/phosphatase n=1 Tax=Kineococcus radiotolerans (strain ATCC BAA-149 / DSM 14245 / SRS30216) TaxID=266940 RepID=A6W7Y7_KINRD|nr:endonuclease/exonuclease/phosphatase family protein [Kineococcus radiotolerans]ABS02926.1 Endonuclease/exonuclease/phosphatase [Kineococcus radiotolerans SRS30216 = ATCC BAA-149]